MEMKVAADFIMAVCLLHAAVAIPLPDPGRQLRVPRIYNALINSDAKLQPSRAYPYSSPVFQPGFEIQEQWQPQEYGIEPEEPAPSQETSTAAPPKENDENDKPKMQKEKATSSALTFYPRSFGFYQPQPIIPYTYSFAPQPFLFGSPYVFGDTFYRYPTLSFDGYHASHAGLFAPGVDQFGSGYKPYRGEGGDGYRPDIGQGGSGHKPDNDQGGSDHKLENKDGQKIDMKTDERHDAESIARKSDLVGIRETEFQSDNDSPETSPDSSDVKNNNDKHETS